MLLINVIQLFDTHPVDLTFRLDLTAASQVHIVEPGWNPMLESQALDRVYRLGQRMPVKTFRYVVDMDGSIEMVIVEATSTHLLCLLT